MLEFPVQYTHDRIIFENLTAELHLVEQTHLVEVKENPMKQNDDEIPQRWMKYQLIHFKVLVEITQITSAAVTIASGFRHTIKESHV